MSRLLSRRTLLRGAVGGATVALGLPLLEAMLNDNGALADEGSTGPIFGIFYWANGLPWHAGHGAEQAQGNYPDDWTPLEQGASYTATPLIAPIAAHQPTIISGLTPKTVVPVTPPGQADGHMRGFMVALTSDRIKPEGFDHPSHTLTALRPSLDQYVAKHDDFYGTELPRYRSLALGVSEARFHGYGHWDAISFNGPDSTNLPIMDPMQLFDLLFSVPDDAVTLGKRAQLLDAVLEDANALRKRVGAADKIRIDSHLEHILEVQRRLELGVTTCEAPAPPSSSTDLIEKTGIMSNLLALALSCGLTRVFSFMLTSPASTHVFSNLNVVDGMHKACHDGDWEDVYQITLYQMQAYSRFMDELAAVTDPTGANLMDRLLIYGCSEYGEGWKHGVKEMPVVFAGGANGKLARGHHIREPDGNMSKAHVTLLRALGIDTPSYGFNGGETSEDFGSLLI